MKTYTTLILLFTSIAINAAAPDEAYVGDVLEVSKSRIKLQQAESVVIIGFVGDAGALLSLEKIKKGNEVRAVFGEAPGPSGHPINKLVTIRVCVKNDIECAADRRRQAAEMDESGRQSSVAMQKMTICNQAMQVTLANDSRFVPENNTTASNDYLARYNALSGKAAACAQDLLKQHEAAYFEACRFHRCGDNVGGGCWHLAGYASTSAAIENAITKCERNK